MTINNNSTTIIMSLGKPSDAEIMYRHETSKPSHGPIHAMVVTPDPKSGELIAIDPIDSAAISNVRSINKIILSGHSSPFGHTVQCDPLPAPMTVPLGQRVRHYSEVVQFVVTFLNKLFQSRGLGSIFTQFTQNHPLRIILRTCCAAIGRHKSLAARMQREFELAHRIPCEINAKSALVYIGAPGFSISQIEYGFRYGVELIAHRFNQLVSDDNTPPPKVYCIPEEKRADYHQVPGSKSTFFTDPATQEQCKRDAYAYKNASQPSDVPIQRIAPPITQADREGYRSHQQIISERLECLKNQIMMIPDTHAFFREIFSKPNTGIYSVIETYYAYQLKNGLKTEHVDPLIQKLTKFLKEAVHCPPLYFEVIAQSNELQEVFVLLDEICENSAQEGRSRAMARGFLNGAAHYSDLIAASTAKRQALSDGIRKMFKTGVACPQQA